MSEIYSPYSSRVNMMVMCRKHAQQDYESVRKTLLQVFQTDLSYPHVRLEHPKFRSPFPVVEIVVKVDMLKIRKADGDKVQVGYQSVPSFFLGLGLQPEVLRDIVSTMGTDGATEVLAVDIYGWDSRCRGMEKRRRFQNTPKRLLNPR